MRPYHQVSGKQYTDEKTKQAYNSFFSKRVSIYFLTCMRLSQLVLQETACRPFWVRSAYRLLLNVSATTLFHCSCMCKQPHQQYFWYKVWITHITLFSTMYDGLSLYSVSSVVAFTRCTKFAWTAVAYCGDRCIAHFLECYQWMLQTPKLCSLFLIRGSCPAVTKCDVFNDRLHMFIVSSGKRRPYSFSRLGTGHCESNI